MRPVLTRLRSSPCELQIIATGSHLDPAFGHTVDDAEADGFAIQRTIPLERSGDDASAVSTAMARALSGIAQALSELQPQMLLILGDRYEIFAAAQAALIAGVPVAHIAGGDISEGAFDDAIRHAISKLSHLHFTTNSDAMRRVVQLGEPQDRVFNFGSPGIDALLETGRMDRQALEDKLDFRLRTRNLAITFHPATLDPSDPEGQVAPLLDALDTFDGDTGLVFTGANADSGGQRINECLQSYVRTRENACFSMSLGQVAYYSLVEQADLVIGNSSSGLYEAPSLNTPSLDIGIRQQGRLRGPSVTHTENDAARIRDAILSLLANPPDDFSSPYGDGTASQRIVEVLLGIEHPRKLLIKHFADLNQ